MKTAMQFFWQPEFAGQWSMCDSCKKTAPRESVQRLRCTQGVCAPLLLLERLLADLVEATKKSSPIMGVLREGYSTFFRTHQSASVSAVFCDSADADVNPLMRDDCAPFSLHNFPFPPLSGANSRAVEDSYSDNSNLLKEMGCPPQTSNG